MKKILMFLLKNERHFILEMPRGAEPVHLAMQGSTPYLWVEVDMDRELLAKDIYCVLTGIQVPSGASHLGSIATDAVEVWHFYWYPNRGGFD